MVGSPLMGVSSGCGKVKLELGEGAMVGWEESGKRLNGEKIRWKSTARRRCFGFTCSHVVLLMKSTMSSKR